MGENFGERLRYFIEKQLFMNVKEFEKKCKFSTGTIHRAINNGTNMGIDKLSVIANNHPELNIDWLLTGEGEMIDPGNSISKNDQIMNTNFKYSSSAETIDKLANIINQLTTNDTIRAKNDSIRAEGELISIKNTEKSLAIQERLVNLLSQK